VLSRAGGSYSPDDPYSLDVGLQHLVVSCIVGGGEWGATMVTSCGFSSARHVGPLLCSREDQHVWFYGTRVVAYGYLSTGTGRSFSETENRERRLAGGRPQHLRPNRQPQPL
jgi:hypothetical protein